MKKTNTDATSPMSVYRTVSSLNGLKSNEILKTKKYSIFATLVGNRGEKQGYEEKRVQKLVALIKSGNYFEAMSIILVNRKGIALDGNNRIEAARRTNTYVLFCVMTEAKYNGSKSETISVVTQFNACNPTWTAVQQYKTALEEGCELAHIIEDLRADFVAGSNGTFKTTDITVSQMMTVVERSSIKTHSLKRNFSEYYNQDYLTYAKTSQFKKEFDFVCRIIQYFKVGALSTNTNAILKQVLYVMWTDNKFNMDIFEKNLRHKSKGFHITEAKSNIIKAKVIELGVVR